MPTGYTADVANGKVTDFATFALRCARNFGATIMQRDDPANDPPKHREPSEYYAENLAKRKARYAELCAMTAEQAEAAAAAEYADALAREAKYADERKQTRQRYEAMLAEVLAWNPPTADHVGMKQFMEQQLVESIDFDCREYPSRLLKMKGSAWLEKAKLDAFESIGRAAKDYEEEQARCAGANAWIDALYASLPQRAVEVPA